MAKIFESFFNCLELRVVSLALFSPTDAFCAGSDVFAALILGKDSFRLSGHWVDPGQNRPNIEISYHIRQVAKFRAVKNLNSVSFRANPNRSCTFVCLRERSTFTRGIRKKGNFRP